MLVHVVTSANAHLYEAYLTQYFQERHKIYAEELGWVPVVADELERDRFDTESAVHFLGVENEKVIAGSRLVPTSVPHLLSEVFPHLCANHGGVPSAPNIAEWTRGFVTREAREGTNKRILFQFCHAVMEYALSEQLSRLGGIQRTYWLTMWDRMGWRVETHGDMVMFGSDHWVPAYFDVSPEALNGALRWAKLSGSILVHNGPYKPFLRAQPEVPTAIPVVNYQEVEPKVHSLSRQARPG